MSPLQLAVSLGRVIRQDKPVDLGKAKWSLLDAALSERKTDETLKWLDYLLNEQNIMRCLNSTWLCYLVRYIPDRHGDAAWESLLTESLAPWIGTPAGLKGQLVASVSVNRQDASLYVPGAPSDFYLTGGGSRYALTLDSPAIMQTLEVANYQGYVGVGYVHLDWEGCNRVDVLPRLSGCVGSSELGSKPREAPYVG